MRLLCLCASLTIPGIAQTITGSITGSVTDPSGAVVPKAKIIATNTDTQVAYSAQTNEAGVYNLLFLPVGSYNVSAEASGFKRPVVGPFRLEVNQIARVDIKLEVGDTAVQVEIKDIAPILQTESSATGDAITSAKLTSIPLNGRNFASLTLLVPGAITVNPDNMEHERPLPEPGQPALREWKPRADE